MGRKKGKKIGRWIVKGPETKQDKRINTRLSYDEINSIGTSCKTIKKSGL